MNNFIKDKDIILDELLKLLTERYPEGLYEYMYQYHPDMYRRIRELEDEVDNASSPRILDSSHGGHKEVRESRRFRFKSQ